MIKVQSHVIYIGTAQYEDKPLNVRKKKETTKYDKSIIKYDVGTA